MTTPSDQERWAAVVAARSELHRVQADFHQDAADPAGVLREALRGNVGGQATALLYLGGLSRDAAALLPELVALTISDRFHGYARAAIAQIRRDELMPELEPLVTQHLESGDDYEYWRLGDLLAYLQAWPLLRDLVQRALADADPEVREAGRFYADEYAVSLRTT
ncbi:hypothetical protein [Actinacidiphila acidipaludis]|uniref:HEAT repeat domain-containing protein n=1 Tax=Actinacidiphila acidipaludis TaxID=2873382 RepID=A0ABS7Q9X2_9ACTN|nr:hypothetical protein [Streptomyces acidipaludis]MBY8879921.1 hypothetical protein [Streptomyces acidipaludis]